MIKIEFVSRAYVQCAISFQSFYIVLVEYLMFQRSDKIGHIDSFYNVIRARICENRFNICRRIVIISIREVNFYAV